MAWIDAARNQSIPLPVREIRSPRGANKSAGWNQPRSRAPASVNFVADLVPAGVLEFSGHPFSAKGNERGKFPGFALLLLQHQPQSLLGQRAESCFFLPGDPLRAFEQIVGNFDGGLHNMAAHILMEGHPYQAMFPIRSRLFKNLLSAGHSSKRSIHLPEGFVWAVDG